MSNPVAGDDALADRVGQVAFARSHVVGGSARGRFRRVSSAAIAGLVARVAVVGCNLALVPMLVGFLGPVQFGIWAAYQSLQGVLVSADFGIGNGMQNAVTVALAQGDTRRSQSLISSAFLAMLLVAAIFGVMAVLLLNISGVEEWLSRGEPASSAGTPLRGGVAMFLAAGLMAIPLSCGERMALAMQSGALTQTTRAIATLLSFACVLMLVRAQASFAAICAASSIPVLVGPALSWIVVARGRAWALPAISTITRSDMLAVLKSGAGFLAVQLTAIAGFGLDPILIERYAGSVEVANYTVVQRLFGLVAMVLGIVLAPLWPAYADARAQGDVAWIKVTLFRSLVATVIVAGGLSMAIAFVAGPIITRWIGAAVSPPPSLVVAFAAWSFVLSCGMAFSYFWNGMHMLRLQAILGLVFVAVSFPAKLLCMQSGSAVGLVTVNAVVYTAGSLLPGAVATWRYLRRQQAVENVSRSTQSAVDLA